MNCPICETQGKTCKMLVTNTYKAGNGVTQRLRCSNGLCGAVGTAVHVLTAVEPVRGDGAIALAKRINAGEIGVTVGKTA